MIEKQANLVLSFRAVCQPDVRNWSNSCNPNVMTNHKNRYFTIYRCWSTGNNSNVMAIVDTLAVPGRLMVLVLI